jgi:DNA polymerase III epsilon subunit-like protein
MKYAQTKLKDKTFKTLCEQFGVTNGKEHGALEDATALMECCERMDHGGKTFLALAKYKQKVNELENQLISSKK